jgi:hypothetical protein
MKSESTAIVKNIMILISIFLISFTVNAQVSDNGEHGSQENQKINETVPVGGIIMWSGTTPPSPDWVLCVGAL